MQVETFECQETAAEPVEATEEAIRLMEEMQLSGQLALVRPRTEQERGVRCPYRKIRADEQFVYRLLCPQATPLEKFSDCPIPLRVLEIAAHARELGIFKEFKVWSAQGQVKEPVLVAYTVNEWHGDCFILARWSDLMDAWPILANKALTIWKENVRAKIAKAKAEMSVDEAAIDSLTLAEAIENADRPKYFNFS